ncbi:integrin-linked protein kinase [Trifolium medium]|uniref:Integrin-linked protein kinase n=1 Tax=Trifolium medium TaxID=97028 RepID=A0A392NRJ9_9FABA|nr:integrin-linked protein kinase [Trifolium medium]
MASSPLSPGKRRPTKSSSESERKGNQSPLVSTSGTVRRKIYEGGNVSDSKTSLKLKTRDQSPFNSLKTRKPQLPLNPSSSPTRIRRVKSTNNASNVRMQKGFISTPPMSPSRTFISKKSGHVSDMDTLKIRGRLSAYGLSPLSPYLRNHKTKRESMSPLSPYVRETCGHVSD